MSPRFDYSLGATLYMPVLHPKVPDILYGRTDVAAASVVLCLEDALADADVPAGLRHVQRLLDDLPEQLAVRTFLRPRSLSMAQALCERAAGTAIDGIVAPKVTPDNLPAWLAVAGEAGLSVMPTLESARYFEPAQISAVRDVLNDSVDQPGRIAAIRIGGNDLLAALGLRRTRGLTAWEGPLAGVLATASSLLMAAGYSVAAPVYDVIDDLDTLRREAERDVAAGFVSKTVIHPIQGPVIAAAFQVDADELAQAQAIIERATCAVFRHGGVMCEPATHRAWAERTLARANYFGVRGLKPTGAAAPVRTRAQRGQAAISA